MSPARRRHARSASGSEPRESADVADGFHQPVLLDESLEYLAPDGAGLYLDGTVGGGGHALGLLERCPGCRVLAVDRDPEALAHASETLAPHRGRVRYLHATFDRAPADAEVRDGGLAGALLDLGVSSRQLDRAERGFQFRRGAPLDMRMSGEGSGPTAADLLNGVGEERLARIFKDFADEPRAWRLAREIVRRRESRPFETSDDLVAALAAAFGRAPTNRDKARIFQALRIALNDELVVLERALPELRDALLPEGVLVVIAYHSLEDRMVKESFREWSSDCVCPPDFPVCGCRGKALGVTLTRKPVTASEAETRRNPRARSARLRAWRKAA